MSVVLEEEVVKQKRADSIWMLLRDPMVVWYGPFPCEGCLRPVIQTGNGAPPLTLDAGDHNHHYPNFQWREHQCNTPRCSFGILGVGDNGRCDKPAKWVSTFNGEVTGAGWCDDHKVTPSTPGHGVRLLVQEDGK